MWHRSFSLRAILLLTVSGLTLMIALMTGMGVYDGWKQWREVNALKNATETSELFFNTIEHLSREREISLALLASDDATAYRRLAPELGESRSIIDSSLSQLPLRLKKGDGRLNDSLAVFERQRADWRVLRREVNRALSLPLAERDVALASRFLNESLVLMSYQFNLWMDFTSQYTQIDSISTQRFMFQHFLGMIIRYAGRERALVSALIVADRPIAPKEQAQLLRWHGMIDLGWDMCSRLAERSHLAPDITPFLEEAQSHYRTLYDMGENMFYLPGVPSPVPYPITVDMWLEVAEGSTDSLIAVKEEALRQTEEYTEMLVDKAARDIALHLLALALAVVLCIYSFWIVNHRVIGPVRRMIRALLDTAEGKPVSRIPMPASPHDEVGQLAQVLNRFQKSTEDVHRGAAMLERYTRDLERSNKELDDFAYIASHDLKEPLRGIHNHSRFLLEDNEGKLDKESTDRIHRLLYLTQRMEKLVNDLLYFSRLGRQELAVQPTDLNEVIHDITTMIDVFLHERNAQVMAPAKLPTLTCDKTRVTEALRNLITNAVKYNDKEEKTVEIGVLPTHPMPDGNLGENVLYVKDNGVGIPLEFHAEVFRIFKRLQNSKHGEEGTGVGLTFVKKIVERHGGKIWLESEPGKGTTFYFTLGSKSDDATAA